MWAEQLVGLGRPRQASAINEALPVPTVPSGEPRHENGPRLPAA